MSGNVYLGRILGIPFSLHWSWFLALFLTSWTLAEHAFPSVLPESAPALHWALGITASLALFASVLLHELGHAVVAKRVGVPVRGIRLFIFGGVMEMSDEPRRAGDEIKIALAGPAVTLAIIILTVLLTWVVLRASGAEMVNTEELAPEFRGFNSWVPAAAMALLFHLGSVNTMLLLFNLIPAFPLDGGRVLRGILWKASGDFFRATRVAGTVGLGFAWLLILWGFYGFLTGSGLQAMWWVFLGLFLQNAAQAGIAHAQIHQLLGGVRVRDMARPAAIHISADEPLQDVLDHYFLRYAYKAYPVLNGDRLAGMLTLRDLQEVDRGDWHMLRAGDLVERRELCPALQPDEPVLDAIRKMADSGHSRLPVWDNGELVGVLSRRDVMDYLEIRAGLAGARGRRASYGRAELLEEARSSV